MFIHPFKRPLYQDKADENASMIAPKEEIVKSADPSDKKYAAA